MKRFKKYLYIIEAVWVILIYLIFRPAINLHSLGFWYFLLLALVPLAFINFDYSINPVNFFKNTKNRVHIIACVVVACVILLTGIVGTPLLGGLNYYRNRISIPEKSTISDIEPFEQTQVQIIDKDISMSLADRVFGELGAEVVSQYKISNNYASCVVNNRMYRITPVEYSGFIKWLSTSFKGTPGFISVDVTTGETKFHELQDGLKYTQNAYFFKNLSFKLRLSYPTFIFGQTKFEVDDNFNPYWVSEVLSYKFVGKAVDIKGVVITNPINGESEYFDVKNVPSWVDNVYPATMICDQYNDYGRLVNGLFNFSQKGITATTDDYAYLQKNGHLWMYTGITSVGNDESNVGFIYVDLQNKDMIYVVSAGAEEYSARASAEGALQEKGYRAVFPTMVNINDEPVYFMGLKDDAGLVKAYAFVSYKNYQKVGIGSTVNEALKNYNDQHFVDTNKLEELTISVEEVQTAVIDGNSQYFIKTTDGQYYHCDINTSDKLPFVKNNDVLNITVSGSLIITIK